MNWIDAIEDFFEEINPPIKCKIVWYKMKGAAYYWWKQIQCDRNKHGREEISSWPTMKKLVISRFSPPTCLIEVPCKPNSSKPNKKDDGDILCAYRMPASEIHNFLGLNMCKDFECEESFPTITITEEFGLGDAMTEQPPHQNMSPLVALNTSPTEESDEGEDTKSENCTAVVETPIAFEENGGLLPTKLVETSVLLCKDGNFLCASGQGNLKFTNEQCYLDSNISILNYQGSHPLNIVYGHNPQRALSVIRDGDGFSEAVNWGMVLDEKFQIVGGGDGKTYCYCLIDHSSNFNLLENVCELMDFGPQAVEIVHDLKGYEDCKPDTSDYNYYVGQLCNIGVLRKILIKKFDPGGNGKIGPNVIDKQRKSVFMLYFVAENSRPFESLEANDLRPLDNYNDAQTSVFGINLQERLEYAWMFVVDSKILGLMSSGSESGVYCVLTNESEVVNGGTTRMNFDPGGNGSINKIRHSRNFDLDTDEHDIEIDTTTHGLVKRVVPELEIPCCMLFLAFHIDQKRYDGLKARSSCNATDSSTGNDEIILTVILVLISRCLFLRVATIDCCLVFGRNFSIREAETKYMAKFDKADSMI